jgi:hypothetical protein
MSTRRKDGKRRIRVIKKAAQCIPVSIPDEKPAHASPTSETYMAKLLFVEKCEKQGKELPPSTEI